MSVQLAVDDWKTAVHTALNAWNQITDTPKSLLEELLLVQEARTSASEAMPVTLRLATNDVLLDCLTELAKHDQTSADILRRRFLDGETVQAVANQNSLGRDQYMRRQRKAIIALTQIILKKETVLREARAQSIEAMLAPPSYDVLFGTEESIARLGTLLLGSDAPWILAITGIGGIGKTSLAHATMRQIIRHFYFERVIWLSIEVADSQTTQPQNKLPMQLQYDDVLTQLASQICPQVPPPSQRELAVKQLLNAFPHLIVIDNLEVEPDSDLLIRLHTLANPSKFLLTSRIRPSSPIGVFNFPLTELASVDAIALMRKQAQLIGTTDLAEAPDDLLQTIYDSVGGNPLALKLIVGLNHDLSLPQIVEALRQAHVQEIEDLYRHIYWKIWQSLSPAAKSLLEVMPISSAGGIVQAQMQAISRLEENQLLAAIQELSQRSLLEVRGTPTEKRYTIHSLTRTFLQSEIIHWFGDSL